MKILSEYIIDYFGLKNGQHIWKFKVNDEFFSCFDYSEFKKGLLNVDIILDKYDNMLAISFNIQGYVNTICDRCLENINININGNKKIIFKFGDFYKEETDEIIIIPENMNSINLSNYILEFITLLAPMRKVHANDEKGNTMCNPLIIEKLNQHLSKKEQDPRWDKLKQLLN